MINTGLMSNKTVEWSTPQDLYDRLNEVWQFTLDPAANHENHKTDHYFTEEDNGLIQDWGGQRVWLNPPYGAAIKDWVEKAWVESYKPHGTVVVCLLPARTDTRWWQQFVTKAALVHFIPGRLKFGGSTNTAPFPSAIVIFGRLTG